MSDLTDAEREALRASLAVRRELDFDRFEYEKIETFGGDTYYVRGRCFHRNVERVESVVTGEVVAQLCLDCQEQLPPTKGTPQW